MKGLYFLVTLSKNAKNKYLGYSEWFDKKDWR
jgi:hypothetical protein